MKSARPAPWESLPTGSLMFVSRPAEQLARDDRASNTARKPTAEPAHRSSLPPESRPERTPPKEKVVAEPSPASKVVAEPLVSKVVAEQLAQEVETDDYVPEVLKDLEQPYFRPLRSHQIIDTSYEGAAVTVAMIISAFDTTVRDVEELDGCTLLTDTPSVNSGVILPLNTSQGIAEWTTSSPESSESKEGVVLNKEEQQMQEKRNRTAELLRKLYPNHQRMTFSADKATTRRQTGLDRVCTAFGKGLMDSLKWDGAEQTVENTRRALLAALQNGDLAVTRMAQEYQSSIQPRETANTVLPLETRLYNEALFATVSVTGVIVTPSHIHSFVAGGGSCEILTPTTIDNGIISNFSSSKVRIDFAKGGEFFWVQEASFPTLQERLGGFLGGANRKFNSIHTSTEMLDYVKTPSPPEGVTARFLSGLASRIKSSPPPPPLLEKDEGWAALLRQVQTYGAQERLDLTGEQATAASPIDLQMVAVPRTALSVTHVFLQALDDGMLPCDAMSYGVFFDLIRDPTKRRIDVDEIEAHARQLQLIATTAKAPLPDHLLFSLSPDTLRRSAMHISILAPRLVRATTPAAVVVISPEREMEEPSKPQQLDASTSAAIQLPQRAFSREPLKQSGDIVHRGPDSPSIPDNLLAYVVPQSLLRVSAAPRVLAGVLVPASPAGYDPATVPYLRLYYILESADGEGGELPSGLGQRPTKFQLMLKMEVEANSQLLLNNHDKSEDFTLEMHRMLRRCVRACLPEKKTGQLSRDAGVCYSILAVTRSFVWFESTKGGMSGLKATLDPYVAHNLSSPDPPNPLHVVVANALQDDAEYSPSTAQKALSDSKILPQNGSATDDTYWQTYFRSRTYAKVVPLLLGQVTDVVLVSQHVTPTNLQTVGATRDLLFTLFAPEATLAPVLVDLSTSLQKTPTQISDRLAVLCVRVTG